MSKFITSAVQKIKSACLVTVTLCLFAAGSASAMGINGLLGVQPGFPQIDGTSGPNGGASFNPVGGGFGNLIVNSTPNLYFPDSNSLQFINGGSFSINAVIGESSISAAGFVLTGGTTTGGLGNPLLVGQLLEYGLENTSPNAGGTDRADFLVNPTGGSMLTDPNWTAGSLIGITLTLEGSNYNGSLNEAWEADRAKFVLGPVASAGLVEPSALALMLLGLAAILVVRQKAIAIRV